MKAKLGTEEEMLRGLVDELTGELERCVALMAFWAQRTIDTADKTFLKGNKEAAWSLHAVAEQWIKDLKPAVETLKRARKFKEERGNRWKAKP